MPPSDTVPVDPRTIDQWTHPPWSGLYDGMCSVGIGRLRYLYALRGMDLGPWLCGRQAWSHRGPVSSHVTFLMTRLTAICSSSIETLIDNGFVPTRTIVLSFGFDEEVSGTEGAQALSEHLLSEYGEDGFAMLIDEGSMSR